MGILDQPMSRTAKRAIDKPGMTTTRLAYTNYYLTIRKTRNSEKQKECGNSTSKLNYIKPVLKRGKVPH